MAVYRRAQQFARHRDNRVVCLLGNGLKTAEKYPEWPAGFKTLQVSFVFSLSTNHNFWKKMTRFGSAAVKRSLALYFIPLSLSIYIYVWDRGGEQTTYSHSRAHTHTLRNTWRLYVTHKIVKFTRAGCRLKTNLKLVQFGCRTENERKIRSNSDLQL